ncbi:uncharacterized protein DS421_8g227100 [Arachis hypogaea]|nr:uncharacterized protein DS421_8g227100 [Arachis hypogaea]
MMSAPLKMWSADPSSHGEGSTSPEASLKYPVEVVELALAAILARAPLCLMSG